jgi:hypothetical protein
MQAGQTRRPKYTGGRSASNKNWPVHSHFISAPMLRELAGELIVTIREQTSETHLPTSQSQPPFDLMEWTGGT